MIVAIYRSGKKAIAVPVKRFETGERFIATRTRNGMKRFHVDMVIHGGYHFDKFRFDKNTAAKICLRGVVTTQDREKETEPKVLKKMNGSYRQQARSRFPELSAPAGGRGIAF
jgi:hypothetical protein